MRVDGVALILRDVRIFHAFGTAVVVVEEVVRELWVDATIATRPSLDKEELRRRMARGDGGDCNDLMITTSTVTRIATLPTVA